MKMMIYSVLLLLSTSAFASDDILGTFDTPSGEPAYIYTTTQVKKEQFVISLGELRVEWNNRVYRIASQNAQELMEVLCYSYKNDFPYTYNTLETRDGGALGFIGGEEVLEYDPETGRLVPSKDDIVVVNAFCQKEMY